MHIVYSRSLTGCNKLTDSGPICERLLWGHRGGTHLETWGLAWLAPHKTLHTQDEISCTVRADVLVTLHQLIQLQAHQACHGSCGGGYGRDDSSSDALALWRTRGWIQL